MTLFKVHQSTLSIHSSVINDMLRLPLSEDSSSDMYDGAPLVEFTEDPKDVEIFLNVFYFPLCVFILKAPFHKSLMDHAI